MNTFVSLDSLKQDIRFAFRRRSGDFLKQLKKSKRPAVLTVKGRAAAIVHDAEEGIRQGLDDVAQGRTRPAREVFDEIRRKHGIAR